MTKPLIRLSSTFYLVRLVTLESEAKTNLVGRLVFLFLFV